MIQLLKFLIENITGSEQFEVSENEIDGKNTLVVRADPSIIGLIIGKQGKTIKNLRRILAIKGTIEKTSVNISVTELS